MVDKVLRRKIRLICLPKKKKKILIRLILFGSTLFLEFSLLLLIMHRNKFLHKIFLQPCNYYKTFNVRENARTPETLNLSIKALVLLSKGNEIYLCLLPTTLRREGLNFIIYHSRRTPVL